MSIYGRHWSSILKLGAVACTLLLCAPVARAQSSAPMAHHAAGRELMRRDLIGLPGKEVVMSTVEVPAGASSPPHRHNAQVFVYMLQGRMNMQVKGGPRVTLGPGEMFYESPSDIQTLSANASTTEPAKFLVLSIKDKGNPGSIPVTPNQAQSAAPAAIRQASEASGSPAPALGALMMRDVIGLPGKEVVVSRIEQEPGASGRPHRHYAQVFVYVLQGRVVMQVKGGPRMTLGAGQTFYENPSDIHVVSANASKTEPAAFLAVLIKDTDKPGTVPVTAD